MGKEEKKSEWIIFFLEKASDWSFKWEIEIKTLDDLLKFIKKNWPIIVRDDLWYISAEDKKNYKYGIKIYDSWVE